MVPTASAARAATLVFGVVAADGDALARLARAEVQTRAEQVDDVRQPQVQQQPAVDGNAPDIGSDRVSFYPRRSLLWLVLAGLVGWAIVIEIAVAMSRLCA
jgi:hypothetical protein